MAESVKQQESDSESSRSRTATPEDQQSRADEVNPDDSVHMESNLTLDKAFLFDELENHFETIAVSIGGPNEKEISDRAWRDALQALASNPTTEPLKQICQPPLKKVWIHLIPDVGERMCPCCFWSDGRDATITSPNGITRSELIIAVADTLYGKDSSGEGKGEHKQLNGKFKPDMPIEPAGLDATLKGDGKFLYRREFWIWCKGHPLGE